MVGRCRLSVQLYIIFTSMVFCGYLDIWTADGNFGQLGLLESIRVNWGQ